MEETEFQSHYVPEFDADLQLYRQAMAESYTKAQRDKRDLDYKMKIISREHKFQLHSLKTQKRDIVGGLLDLQTKTKGLNDTLTYITTSLEDEKKEAEIQLTKMAIERSNGRLQEPLFKETEPKIRKKLDRHKEKLNWLKPKQPDALKQLRVMELVGSKTKGFRGVLHKIREKKNPKEKTEIKETMEEEEEQKKPEDICSLIDRFKKLPKIYPTKPKKPKVKATEVMIAKYKEKQADKEKLMSFATRTRIRRVNNHYNILYDLFVNNDVKVKV